MEHSYDPPRSDLNLIGVAPGDPYSARTFSGSSAGLFRALEPRCASLAALSAEPAAWIRRWYQAASFRPSRADWVFRYRMHPGLYAANTRAAQARIARYPAATYDTVLQIASFYNLAKLPGRMTVSYHDATLGTLLRSPYAADQRRDGIVQGSLDFERRLYHDLDHLFTMSAWAADSIVADFGVPRDKITVAGAGINVAVDPLEEKSYAEPAVLFVGKEFERKGGPMLLRAFAQARATVPEATLTIIGPREIGAVPDGVRFVGFLDGDQNDAAARLNVEYRRATMFAMPSRYEPFGMVFLEAMAYGLACLASDACAMPEIVEDGTSGFVVPLDDLDTLTARLIDLLRRPELRREMGQRAERRYRERFGWGRAAAVIVETIAALRERRAPSTV